MNITVPFNQQQIIWALLLAAQMVLLVVLIGRARMERFRWFTISIMITALRQLVSELLYNRIAQIAYNFITLTLAILAVLTTLIVVIELARIIFHSATLRNWLLACAPIVTGCAIALYFWGPWPPKSEFDLHTQLGVLRFMQLITIRGQLFVAMLTVFLGGLAIFQQRKGNDFWRSHVVKILFGFTTFALILMVTRALGQWIAILANAAALQHTDQERTQAIIDRLIVVPQVTMILVQVWWIYSLWHDEGAVQQTASAKLK